MSYISLDEVVATASTIVKDSNSLFKLLCREWICRFALPELGISDDDVKIAQLIPINYTVLKPADFRALVDISLFDSTGNQLAHKFRAGGKRIYRDSRLRPVASNTDQTLNGLIPCDISMDNQSFHLGTNADQVASIVVRYYCYPVDDETGLPLIRQEEALACVYFCRFMWSARQNDNRSEIEQNRTWWMLEADRVKAKKKMASLTPEHMKRIVNSVWVRSIPNFREFNSF